MSRKKKARRAIEEMRRAPLEPEIPLDDEVIPDVVDPDALEVLNETQTLAGDEDPDSPPPSAERVDRERGAILAGGDVDAAWDQADDTGEEAVGGSTPTPDQNVVDDLGRAAGVSYSDSEPLRPEEKEAERDDKRWEVDPASSEDYEARQRALGQRARKRRRTR
jgi:hypothetical protein